MSQAVEFASSIDEQLSRWLGAIPVLIPIFQRLNVVSIINRYCPCQADADEGTVALVLCYFTKRMIQKSHDKMTEIL